MLGMVRSKYLPGGLHGCEGAAISVSALGSFHSAVARAVWSKMMALGDLIRLSSSFGVVFDNSDSIFLIVLMRKIAFFDC